ncbi:MAG: ABC transporter permease [Lachnospiraceae bacterium]|nr:ABC transporter permease [Lachnospiraceae bacterium]
MLKLVKCEFSKLKRKKFILLVILSALLFPVPLTIIMTMPQTAGQYGSKIDIFNAYFQFVMGYGVELLLPCMIGVAAAMLFFMERDNDTFKNLRTIPVTSTQMVLAKIVMLFFFGIIFSLASAVISIICGGVIAEVSRIAYRLLFAMEMGILITAGTLPLVVLVVFFSKTYVFSILLCVFYSVLSLTAESCYGALPKLMCWLMPIPLTNLWCAGNLNAHGVLDNIGALEYLIPTTFQTIAILTVIAFLSVLLIDYMYKKRGDE